MLATFILAITVIFTVLVSNVTAQSFDTTDPKQRALATLQSLHIWYNAGNGVWDTCGWWNSANVMTMISNYAKRDPDNEQIQNFASRIFANTAQQAPKRNPQPGIEEQDLAKRSTTENGTEYSLFNTTGGESGYYKLVTQAGEYRTIFPEGWDTPNGEYVDILSLPISQADLSSSVQVAAAPLSASDWLDGYYDDDLWWALAWIGAYDVTSNMEYLQLAEDIFMKVTQAGPTRCGNGGIYWRFERDYVNAIANELFLSTAAHLANRAENKDFYIDWAKRQLQWFLDSGMINERGTINDGLTDECENNNRTTWSYNQGVLLGALSELHKASPNATYLDLAARTAKAAIAELSDENGILHDQCGPYCGGDASQFKGIFARNLQLLHEAAPDEAYVQCVQKNAESIWRNDRGEGNVLSVDWAGPFLRPANASTHSSAMDALVAAVTVVGGGEENVEV